MHKTIFSVMIAAAILVALPAAGQNVSDLPAERPAMTDRQVIVPQYMAGAIAWQINAPADRVFLRVVGPSGEVYSQRFEAPEQPYYDFLDMDGAPLPDGEYGYEIIARRALSLSESSALAQARKIAASAWDAAAKARRSSSGDEERTRTSQAEVEGLERAAMKADRDLRELRERLRRQNGPFAFTASERFDVRRGTVEFRETRQRSEVENTVAAPGPDVGTMDTTDAGDIKAGSGLAAGDTSLSPGDGHLWLYSTSPKITLTDPDDGTPKSWDISASADSFNIISQNGTAPIRIEALSNSAPISSFYIDSLGRVGLGTGAPATNLEIVNFSPELRLRDLNGGSHSVLSQDAGEFQIAGDNDQTIVRVDANALSDSLKIDTHGDLEVRGINIADPLPQLSLEDLDSKTWNIQVGIFGELQLQNVSNSNAVPLRIYSSAPMNSLVVDGNGDVGIGTYTPNGRFHIVGTDSPRVRMEDTTDNANDKPGLAMKSPASANGGEWRFETDNAGNFQIDYNLSAGPEIVLIDDPVDNSRVKINGELVVQGTCTGCDAVFESGYPLESIEEHASLMWENNYLPAVGPTPDGETGINVFEKTVGILQELEKAHIYIEQLHEEKKEIEELAHDLEEQVRMLNRENSKLAQRLEDIAAQVRALESD